MALIRILAKAYLLLVSIFILLIIYPGYSQAKGYSKIDLKNCDTQGNINTNLALLFREVRRFADLIEPVPPETKQFIEKELSYVSKERTDSNIARFSLLRKNRYFHAYQVEKAFKNINLSYTSFSKVTTKATNFNLESKKLNAVQALEMISLYQRFRERFDDYIHADVQRQKPILKNIDTNNLYFDLTYVESMFFEFAKCTISSFK